MHSFVTRAPHTMSSSLLARRIYSSIYSFTQHHHLAPLTPLLRLSLSTKTQPPKEFPFIAQYLISSFGFSPDRALKVSTSRSLGAIKSCDRPEAVVQFLKGTGLSDSQIKCAIKRNPVLLRYNVEKSMKPNLVELTTQGFSVEILAELIQCSPVALALRKTPSRLLFWRDFTGNDDKVLLRLLKKNRYMLAFDIDKHIIPKMDFLKECGLSSQHIALMLCSGRSCMTRSLDGLRQVIEIVENMGLQRGSGMFFGGVNALVDHSIDTIKRKTEFFKTTYGWSEQDIHIAFCKFPNILRFSEANMQSKMDFLIREVKLNPRSIALMPTLLGYSLEKRLIPRHRVLSILEAKKLKEKCSLYNACAYSEINFINIHIKPYEKDAPELSDAYFTALGGKIGT